MKKFGKVCALMLLCNLAIAQQVPLGQWRLFLPYGDAISLADAGSRMYCAAQNGLFYVDKTDNSITRMDRLTGLSGIEMQAVRYNSNTKSLVVAYKDANIDIIEGNTITNIPDIQRKAIPGKKAINSIFCKDQYAYLCCSFGIIVLDLEKKEIKDTYYISPDGNALEVYTLIDDGNNAFYAGTAKGVLTANVNNPNLANYSSWKTLPFTKDKPFNLLAFYNNKLIANKTSGANSDSLFSHDNSGWKYLPQAEQWTKKEFFFKNGTLFLANYFRIEEYDTAMARTNLYSGYENISDFTIDDNNLLWVADPSIGLVKFNIQQNKKEVILPNGPKYNYATTIVFKDSLLWVSTGTLAVEYRRAGVMKYNTNLDSWRFYDKSNTPAFDTVYDTQAIAIDPKDANHIYVSSWGKGIVEMKNGQVIHHYNIKNSTLQSVSNYYFVGVGGLALDNKNNLWANNRMVDNPLSVLKNDGTWKSFSLNNKFSTQEVTSLIIDAYGQKWIGGNGALAVFSDNNTIDDESDDKVRILNEGKGSGGLLNAGISSLAEDAEGNIWIGTAKGISVHYSPGTVLTSNNYDAQQIIIVQDGNAQYLLDTEIINTIVIDASNKKWIGTRGGGVYLLSPDGSRQILHFNTDNSPLPSNEISSISINPENGEVFIATTKGIASYKSNATIGGETYSNVYAYPNPVTAGYEGKIGIKGLVANVNVKITDVGGRAVYETPAEGGQAVWDGKDFNGEKVNTGVYLIFCTDKEGTQTMVGKLLFVN